MEVEVMTKELAKFNITDAAIAELRSQYMALTVKGLDDKPGLDAVHRARMDIKGRRVAVEKTRKALKEDALKWGQTVDGEAKRIFALLEPIEDHLTQEETRVTDELARIKAEAAAREAARIKERVDQLYKLDCRFDGTTWLYSGVEIATQAKIASATDEQFDGLLADLQAAIDEAAAVAAEEARVRAEQEAELRRVAAEQEAERIRLAEEAARIKAEQEAQAKAMAQAQAKIDAERKALEDERKRLIDEAAAKEKAAADAIVAAEKEKQRLAELEQAKKDAAAKALADAEAKAKAEAEAAAAKAEKARLAAERKAARMPDKDKLIAYLRTLDNVPVPELKHEDAVAVLHNINVSLNSVLVGAEKMVDAL